MYFWQNCLFKGKLTNIYKESGGFMIAVLTGDIVDSTKMSPQDYNSAVNLLQSSIEYCQEHFAARGEIYRGDGIQLVFSEAQYAMKAAILIKTLLLSSLPAGQKIEITMALGLGDQSVSGATPGVSQGSAFTFSGRGLDLTQPGALSVHLEAGARYDALELATQFLNHLLQSLTQVQARVLYYYLLMDFPTHAQLAKKLNTSQQNVTKHLSRIGVDLVENYLNVYAQQVSKDSM
ncbi:MAG: hypothetical protein ACI808_003384 [Paraglaciecola sp.]